MNTFFDTYYGQLVVNYSLVCMVVLGFYLTFLAGQISVAHQLFMAAGSYVAGYLAVKFGLHLYVLMPVAALAGAFVATITGLLTLRLTGMFLAVATLAIAESGVVALNNLNAVGGIQGFGGIPTTASGPLIVMVTVGAIAFTALVDRSSFGLWLRATGDDQIAAEGVGVRVNVARVAAFALGGALAGVSGSLYAHRFGYLEPSTFGLAMGIQLLLAAKLGGKGSVAGPLCGSAFVVLLPELLRIVRFDREVVFGLLLILVIILRPEGVIARRGRLMALRAKNAS